MRVARALVAVLLCAAAGGARAQTMLDQEERLIDLHALLLDLPPAEAPGALAPWALSVGGEAIGIPEIDGQTGGKRQITASDRTRVFPRPRLALGLPAPAGLRAFVGGAYIPPLAVREVATHYGAAEAGLAWAHGALPLRVGLRVHATYARSTAPVTDPATRDVLRTWEYGADAAAGWTFATPVAAVTPYAGAGVVATRGRFTVTSDGAVLVSDWTGPALHAGVRVLVRERWVGVAEVDGYPGRLVHPVFKLAYVFR